MREARWQTSCSQLSNPQALAADATLAKRIFGLMPSEISKQNKRFVVRDISGDSHVDRCLNDFLCLADANVALPTYNVTEPRYPLRTSLESRKFKLFMSGVGLLTTAA